MNQKEYEIIASVFDDLACELMEAGLYETLVRAFELKLITAYPKSFNAKKFLERSGLAQ